MWVHIDHPTWTCVYCTFVLSTLNPLVTVKQNSLPSPKAAHCLEIVAYHPPKRTDLVDNAFGFCSVRWTPLGGDAALQSRSACLAARHFLSAAATEVGYFRCVLGGIFGVESERTCIGNETYV